MKSEEASETEFQRFSSKKEKIARGVLTGVLGLGVVGSVVWGSRLTGQALSAGVPLYMLTKVAKPASVVGAICFKLAYQVWTGKEHKDPNELPSVQDLSKNAEELKATIADLERQGAVMSKDVDNKMEPPAPTR